MGIEVMYAENGNMRGGIIQQEQRENKQEIVSIKFTRLQKKVSRVQ
jgi:hypothetical protein